MEIIKEYGSFNQRRYSDPWVAKMIDGQISFDERVGEYTGGYRTGNDGKLVVYKPEVGQIYAYGQKDHRGNQGERGYVRWDGEKFEELTREEVIA